MKKGERKESKKEEGIRVRVRPRRQRTEKRDNLRNNETSFKHRCSQTERRERERIKMSAAPVLSSFSSILALLNAKNDDTRSSISLILSSTAATFTTLYLLVTVSASFARCTRLLVPSSLCPPPLPSHFRYSRASLSLSCGALVSSPFSISLHHVFMNRSASSVTPSSHFRCPCIAVVQSTTVLSPKTNGESFVDRWVALHACTLSIEHWRSFRRSAGSRVFTPKHFPEYHPPP